VGVHGITEEDGGGVRDTRPHVVRSGLLPVTDLLGRQGRAVLVEHVDVETRKEIEAFADDRCSEDWRSLYRRSP
jgi:hypothetical protein